MYPNSVILSSPNLKANELLDRKIKAVGLYVDELVQKKT